MAAGGATACALRFGSEEPDFVERNDGYSAAVAVRWITGETVDCCAGEGPVQERQELWDLPRLSRVPTIAPLERPLAGRGLLAAMPHCSTQEPTLPGINQL